MDELLQTVRDAAAGEFEVYGELGRSGGGSTIKYFETLNGLAGVALVLIAYRTLVVSRTGIVLTSSGTADRQLAKESDQYTVSLQFSADAVELLVPGMLKPVPVAKPTKELVMSWDVGVGRSIDLRFRVVPSERKKKQPQL